MISVRRMLPSTLKGRLRRVLSPWRVSMGSDSCIRRPYSIANHERIRMGKRVTILAHASLNPITEYAGIAHNPMIVIGDGSYVGRHVSMYAVDRIDIGQECVLSDFIYLSDSSHGFDPAGPPILEQPLSSRGPIRLGARCFLGYRTVIMPGVTLGEHCIVGANSVVTRSFPAYSVLGGVPARLIKTHGPCAKELSCA